MSVRMRVNKSKTSKRRSQIQAEAARLSTCPDCGASHRRHTACQECGRYRGRVVVDMTAKIEKQERKRREKEEALQAQGAAPQAEEAPAKEEKQDAQSASGNTQETDTDTLLKRE